MGAERALRVGTLSVAELRDMRGPQWRGSRGLRITQPLHLPTAHQAPGSAALWQRPLCSTLLPLAIGNTWQRVCVLTHTRVHMGGGEGYLQLLDIGH